MDKSVGSVYSSYRRDQNIRTFDENNFVSENVSVGKCAKQSDELINNKTLCY